MRLCLLEFMNAIAIIDDNYIARSPTLIFQVFFKTTKSGCSGKAWNHTLSTQAK